MPPPDGMLQDTFDYVIAFTIAHEGDTQFMYNNWPLKNPNPDVTVGVGRALPNENAAASAQIRNLFSVDATNSPAGDADMRQEFRRVWALPRTATNLFSAYRDASPLTMDRDGMLRLLEEDMLAFWRSNGQTFPNFDQMPAQAQVALMSYNYGLRLSRAPRMCNAVRAGDYLTAANESSIAGWDAQKNAAHRRLFENAAAIIANGLALETLPPITGPFKPPPAV